MTTTIKVILLLRSIKTKLKYVNDNQIDRLIIDHEFVNQLQKINLNKIL